MLFHVSKLIQKFQTDQVNSSTQYSLVIQNSCYTDYLVSYHININFVLMSTSSVSACTIGFDTGRFSSLGSNLLCGGWIYITSHNLSMRRSLTISIPASLIFVYAVSTLVVPNGRFIQRRASLPMIYIHVDPLYEFAWTHWYTVYISVLIPRFILMVV